MTWATLTQNLNRYTNIVTANHNVYRNQYKLILQKHPQLDRMVTLSFYFFKAAGSAVMVHCLPFAKPINAGLILAYDLYYNASVEARGCKAEITLPSFAGCVAFCILKWGMDQLVKRTFLGYAMAVAAAVPSVLYTLKTIELSGKAVAALRENKCHGSNEDFEKVERTSSSDDVRVEGFEEVNKSPSPTFDEKEGEKEKEIVEEPEFVG